jgi:D-arabinose 1-dehydrogenase-like Zn-dependent alcohol dehydrogenase
MHDACGHCKECLEGWNTFCVERKLYGYANLDQGSFSDGAVWKESFLFKLPDGISDEHAAPLVSVYLLHIHRKANVQQCGGATVFTALLGVQPSDVIGIMGVGGLGHLAIQFAAKLGCRVVVLSRSDRKKQEALDLGAHQFIATANMGKDTELEHPITRLLVTTSAQPDWEQILSLMSTRSTIFPLSVSDDKLTMPYMPLLIKGITVQGSLVATRAHHRQMLDFAALHGIKPIIEKFPMSEEGLKTAMDKLEKGDIYYRAVLLN